MNSDENSLGDQNTFDGGEDQFDPQSLGDEGTFVGGGGGYDPQSLGDEMTLGGQAGGGDDSFDDDMEVVDLEARYKMEGVLGKGGMGEVLLATDTRLNRKVAIKRILGSAARSKTAVSRFLTEAQSVAALNHPNIVQIYDYGRAKDGPFLIMEYVESESLLDKCRKGPIELEEAIDLTCQLCDGLSKAHAANIIHRDIKPANVLMTPDGVPKLTDFGLAKDDTADTGVTMAGAVLGTLDFMPPEQRKDAALTDNRSDLWSLAAALYQMVAGEPPRVIDLDVVPQELRKCISRALKSKKEERYQTAIEFRDALRSSLAAPKQVIQTAVLGAGECPECHTQNESSRKFCSECAASLRVSCLKCETEIPIWEKVCGECGGQQKDLLEVRNGEFEEKKRQAEQFVSEYQFNKALAICQEISAIDDLRFAQFSQWFEEFGESTRKEWEGQKVIAHQHLDEAKKHREVFDYQSAIQAIESIPEPMRSTEVHGYLSLITSDRDESVDLIRKIRESISNRKLDDLLPKVERTLILRGDRSDLVKLKEQLISRDLKQKRARDKYYTEAKKAYSLQNYSKCLAVLRKIRSQYFTDEIQKLQIAAQDANQRVVQLDRKIEDAISNKQFDNLLKLVETYLSLQERDTRRQALRNQLITREQNIEKNKQLKKDQAAAIETSRLILEGGSTVDAIQELQNVDSVDASVEFKSWLLRVQSIYQEHQSLIRQFAAGNSPDNLLKCLKLAKCLLKKHPSNPDANEVIKGVEPNLFSLFILKIKSIVSRDPFRFDFYFGSAIPKKKLENASRHFLEKTGFELPGIFAFYDYTVLGSGKHFFALTEHGLAHCDGDASYLMSYQEFCGLKRSRSKASPTTEIRLGEQRMGQLISPGYNSEEATLEFMKVLKKNAFNYLVQAGVASTLDSNQMNPASFDSEVFQLSPSLTNASGSADKLVDRLEALRLIDREIIDALREQLIKGGANVTAEAVAKLLVDNGHLTKFQANKLISVLGED